MPPKKAPPIELLPRTAASGTVRDSGGHLIAGATVTASISIPRKLRKRVLPPNLYDANPGPDEIRVPQRLDGILSTTTDANGTVLLDGLPQGEPIALHVDHPEAGDATLGVAADPTGRYPFTLDPDAGPAEVVLPGAGSLLGRVLPPAEGA